MFKTALRAASVRSSARLVPSASTGMPIVAAKRRGIPYSGSTKSVLRVNRGQRILFRAASPGRIAKRTTHVAAISTAVTHTSPSPWAKWASPVEKRSEEHTSELQSPYDLVCRLLLEKKKKQK